MKRIRTIALDGTDVSYVLSKRRGQRQMALSVHGDGRVTLTMPKWVPLKTAEAFLREKQAWVLNALASVPESEKRNPAETYKQYRKHKEAARCFVHKRLAELNQHYGFRYKNISIRNNTSRWGSCSEHGNLNFDFRILFLEPHLQDYLLVHELCHLREMNHSKRFWCLVAERVPDYRAYRREMYLARAKL